MQREILNQGQYRTHLHHIAEWIAVTRIGLIIVVNVACLHLFCYASTISATSTSLAAVADVQTDSRNWYFSTLSQGTRLHLPAGTT